MWKKVFENINICVLSGKIVSEVKFDFVYNHRKHVSIVSFWVETNSIGSTKAYQPCINKVYAYDDMADELYRNFEKGDFITLSGSVESNQIEIIEFDVPDIDEIEII